MTEIKTQAEIEARDALLADADRILKAIERLVGAKWGATEYHLLKRQIIAAADDYHEALTDEK